MKNQYVGDVNDYVKYGLLRCFSEAGFSVGVNWMLTPDDGKPDGRKLNYLEKPGEWLNHDADLYCLLTRMVSLQSGRHVKNIEKHEVLAGARFHGEVVLDQKIERGSWF